MLSFPSSRGVVFAWLSHENHTSCPAPGFTSPVFRMGMKAVPGAAHCYCMACGQDPVQAEKKAWEIEKWHGGNPSAGH